MRSLMLLLAILLGTLASPVFGQTIGGVNIPSVQSNSQSAVPAAIDTFAKILNPRNSLRLGVPPSVSVGQAQVQTALVEFVVSLDSLRDFQRETDPLSLLSANGRVIYPLATGSGNFSSIVLMNTDSRWKAVSFGSPATTRAYSTTRNSISNSTGIPISEVFVVRVPALNLYCLGHLQAGLLMLTPVFDYVEMGVLQGRTIDAQSFFSLLVSEAQQHNGQPG